MSLHLDEVANPALWHPQTMEDCALVQQELEAIVRTAAFANSRRYPAFLRFVVETTLAGRAEELKERTVGIEVFGRPPDYDTNSDTVVRFTAGEVRKRLTAHYHERASETSLLITLPVGGYVPEFYRTEPTSVAAATLSPRPLPISPSPIPSATLVVPTALWKTKRALLSLSIAALLLAGLSLYRLQPTSEDRFWRSVGSSANPIVLSPGTVMLTGNPPTYVAADSMHQYTWMSTESAQTLARLTAMLGRQEKPYLIQPTPNLTLTDVRTHSVVLIGAYTNDWTMRLVDGLRFHFTPLDGPHYIVDVQDSSRRWTGNMVNGRRTTDYAIVARYHDPLTENTVVILAGLNKGGTAAASELVTSRKYLDDLQKSWPRGWEKKNLELVLETDLIANKTSAPRIIASHFW